MTDEEKNKSGFVAGIITGILVAILSTWFGYVFSGLRSQITQFQKEQYKIFDQSDLAILNIKTNARNFRKLCKARNNNVAPDVVYKFAQKNGQLGQIYFNTIHNVGFYYNRHIFNVAHAFYNWQSAIKFTCTQLPIDKTFDDRHNTVFYAFARYLYSNFLFGIFRP